MTACHPYSNGPYFLVINLRKHRCRIRSGLDVHMEDGLIGYGKIGSILRSEARVKPRKVTECRQDQSFVRNGKTRQADAAAVGQFKPHAGMQVPAYGIHPGLYSGLV